MDAEPAPGATHAFDPVCYLNLRLFLVLQSEFAGVRVRSSKRKFVVVNTENRLCTSARGPPRANQAPRVFTHTLAESGPISPLRKYSSDDP